jgi:hypothetical protein
MGADLTTLANVKAWLPDFASVTAYDPILSRLITACSNAVCVYTGRTGFDVESYSELYDGRARPWIVLRQWPAITVSSVFVSASFEQPPCQLEPPVAGGGAQRLTLERGFFPRGISNVTVTYSAGYAMTPPDVEQAVIELVGERFRARERIGLTSKGLSGQESTSFATTPFNSTIAALLAPYRRVCPW